MRHGKSVTHFTSYLNRLKNSMKERNPFLKYGYLGPEFFADREKETDMITKTLLGGNNVTLLSPRRMGKTGLIKNVFHTMQQTEKDAIFIYLDIFATRTFKEMVQQLATGILAVMQGRGEKLLDRLLTILASLRPQVSFDELTGNPQFSMTLEPAEPRHTLEQLFNYMEQSGKECFVAIDEFQQVAKYQDQNAEAILRSHIQFLRNVHFIFSGSSRHLMTEMFLSARRPFYHSTSILDLKPIDKVAYMTFAQRFFEKRGDTLAREAFDNIYDRFQGHTWYIQAVLNKLYDTESSVTESSQVDLAVRALVEENSSIYENIVATLTDNQLNLMRELAREGTVTEINGTRFVRGSGLKSSSSVNSALKSLIDKELVYHDRGEYSVYDRFMSLWLRS